MDSDDDVFDEAAAQSEQEMELDEEDIDDTELDEDLALPKDLRGIGVAEKHELLQFKRTHNEIEWEEELLRRTDQLRKYRDLEELNKLRSKGAVEKAPAKEPKAKAKAKAPKRKARVVEESEEEEDDDDDEDEDEDRAGSEDEDEDWFDNDEVERITALTKEGKSKEAKSKAKSNKEGSKAPKTKRKSRLDEHSDDSEGYEGYASDDSLGLKPLKRRRDAGSPTAPRQRRVIEKPPSPEAQLSDILRIQIRRHFISTNVNEAFFEEVMVGSYVRVLSHNDPNTNEAVYKMAMVLEVRPFHKDYIVEASIKKTTNKVMILEDGSGRLNKWRNIKMSLVSNSRITETEFGTYLRHVSESEGQVSMPSVDDVEEKRMKNVKAATRVLEEKDILKAVRGSSGFERSQTLAQGVTVVLDGLERQLAEAQESGDILAADRTRRKIAKIQNDLEAAKHKYGSTAGKFNNINQRNRDLNIQMDNEAARRKKENEKKATGADQVIDPFARRETRPKILWITGNKKKKDEEKEGLSVDTALGAAPAQAPAATPSASYHRSHDSIETINARIAAKLGIDFLAEAAVDKRTRYISQVCRSLPALGTEEREKVRNGVSLQRWREMADAEEGN